MAAQEIYVHRSRIPILVLGPFSSGKRMFLDDIRGDTPFSESESTAEVTLNPATIGAHHYLFVDTPGLDNPNISDHGVFNTILEYLITGDAMKKHRLAGVLYIHRLEDSLESRTLHRNMQVILRTFLGADWYSGFTILALANSKGPHLDSMFQALSLPKSPFSEAIFGGARAFHASEETRLDRILEFYTLRTPALLQIQATHGQVLPGFIGDSIERCLGYLDIKSVGLHLEAQAENINRAHQADLDKLRSKRAKSKARELSFVERLTEIETELVSYHDKETLLRCQFEQTQAEYASLRSQLQIRENVEQGDIVHALHGLNREIEDVGRLFSEFLVDIYVAKHPNFKSIDVTTLHAYDLPKLKEFLGHQDGPSLVASSHGQGLGVEDFFDYTIRAMLCKYLHEWIFNSFHPGAEELSISLGTLYSGIRRREPQAAAAKWRATSFKSIYKHNDPDATSDSIRKITQIITRSGLNPLTNFFFGEQAGVTFEEEHHARIERLVRTAWEWNSMLKEEVLILGDFTQTYYEAGSRFNPQVMTEFDTRPGGPAPNIVLATLALGLDSSQAVGGGCPPEVTHVCKAVVATESAIYDWPIKR